MGQTLSNQLEPLKSCCCAERPDEENDSNKPQKRVKAQKEKVSENLEVIPELYDSSMVKSSGRGIGDDSLNNIGSTTNVGISKTQNSFGPATIPDISKTSNLLAESPSNAINFS